MTTTVIEHCPVCKRKTYQCNCSKEALWLEIWRLQAILNKIQELQANAQQPLEKEKENVEI